MTITGRNYADIKELNEEKLLIIKEIFFFCHHKSQGTTVNGKIDCFIELD